MRLIDADALEVVITKIPDGMDTESYIAGMDFVLAKIDNASTIEERKTGEWIFHETENDRYDDVICPFCRKSYTVDSYRIDDIGFTAEDFNCCPNCGADMRGSGKRK